MDDVADPLLLLDRLARSEARFRTMIERNADGVIILDASGTVRYANPAAEALFDRAAADLAGRPFGFPVVAGEAAEIDLLSHGGQPRAAELRVVAIEWEGAEGFLASLRDVTARRQAERLAEDRNRVLETVARSRPLGETLALLGRLVERQRPGLPCVVALLCDGQLYYTACGDLPQGFLATAQELEAEPADRRVEQPDDAAAGSPRWRRYRELLECHRLRPRWATPIRSGAGATLGEVALFGASEPEPEDLRLLEMAGHLAAIAAEHVLLTRQIVHQAQHDPLTGLPNRLLFGDRLQQAIAAAQRNETLVALLYLDLDRFKVVNDTFGHPVGDALLRAVAERLHGSVRQNDTLARMGGDEFTLVLSDLKVPQGAVKVAKKLLAACEQPFVVDGRELHITASIGISLYPEDGATAEELLRKADHALYRSKEHGRNIYQLYSTEMSNAIAERMQLELLLRGALERKELVLCYQPQLDTVSRRFAGMEALIRWRHPELGLVAPGRFIPIAEENGLIVPIGTWALREACRQGMRSPLQVAVNVSPMQFYRPDFVETVAEALTITALPPQSLELELTERTLMKNTGDTQSKLADLRALGVSIAIDDFGVGYSSLSYLQRLPITTLKIDRTFVRDIGRDMERAHGDAAIVRAITTMAHTLGMTVVAEGVETEEQLDFLLHVGCDRVQGFLLGRPMPPEELAAALG